jgi:single-strand DNA-binding protein
MALPDVIGQGTVGIEPKLEHTKNGVPFCRLRVACDDMRKNATGAWTQAGTSWITLMAWRGTAESIAANVHKGEVISFSGKLKVRESDTPSGKREYAEIEVKYVNRPIPSVPATQVNPTEAEADKEAFDPWAAPAF